MPSRARAWVAAAAALTLVGCSLDDVMHAIPWFGNMIHQRSIKPYAMTRPVPEGVVPVGGIEPDWTWPTADLSFVNGLVNPRPSTPPSVARGQELYEVYCLVCHGLAGGSAVTGLGDGPVAQKFPGIPSVVTDRAKAYSDGYLYSIVRYGRGLMPRYGDKVRAVPDRWDLVNYLRQLQQQGPAR